MSAKKLTKDELRAHKGISFTGITTVFLCHDGNGNLLLGKRSNNARDEHGRWDVGGGGLKYGEAVEQSMLREVQEEYNAVPIAYDFIGYFDAFRTTNDNDQSHWLAMCFAVLVDPAQIKINEPDMIDEIGWFKLDDLPTPMHSQFSVFIAKHGEKLRECMLLQESLVDR